MAFARILDDVPLTAGATALKTAVDQAETSLGVECHRLHHLSVPPSAALPAVRLYAPGSSGPKSVHQLIAPHAWRLPSERAWRAPNRLGG